MPATYTFQPIDQVTGCLMAIELMTAVAHPSAQGYFFARPQSFNQLEKLSFQLP